MLSNTADYAIRAILVLARHRGAWMRADQVAADTGAPRNYLAKTLNALAKAGIVASARGPQGGFALAVAPEELTLLRVIELFDGPRRRPCCLLGSEACDPAHPCAAHHRWTAITAARRAPLAATTIADLVGTDRPLATLDTPPTAVVA